MLPPLTTGTTFFPLRSTLLKSAAATEVTPAGSASNLPRWSRRYAACAISVSVTLTMSSTYFWMMSKVSVPGVFTAIPSAIVDTDGRETISLASLDATIEAAPAALTPMTLTLGFISFIAIAIPAMRPPPPIGTMTASTSGCCS